MYSNYQTAQKIIAKSLKKTTYWVRKVLQKQKINPWTRLKGLNRPVKFQKIHQRARTIID